MTGFFHVFRVFVPTLLCLLLFTGAALGEKINTNPTLAIQGFDAVAYFAEGKSRLGNNGFQHEHQGATWFFVNQENLDAFKADPAKYTPQYGGFCAWAAAENYLAPADPEVFAVRNGKLYLNFNRDVQKKWLKDPAGFITRGDANWPKLSAN